MKRLISAYAFLLAFASYSQSCFSPYSSFYGGFGPGKLDAADFNGDMKTDLVVSNTSVFADSVTILFGNGAGSFTATVGLQVATQPLGLCSGDFNNDGFMDIAVGNYASSSISVLLGTGNGNFASAVNYPTGTWPVDIISCDLNLDGNKDLVTANEVGDNISVFLGTGSGTFGSASHLAAGDSPTEVIAADFNGDGKIDLAVTSDNGSVAVINIFISAGNGTFGSTISLPAANLSRYLCCADFNLDGKADLATANDSTNLVWVYAGLGNGTFASGTSYFVNWPKDIVTADFNGDCRPDLAACSYISDKIAVLLNSGSGAFSPAVYHSVGIMPHSLCTADLDGIGNPDLAAVYDSVFVLLNCSTNTCVDPTGLISFHANAPVRVFPNPASEMIELELNEDIQLGERVMISNSLGMMVYQGEFTNIIDVSGWPAGYYTLTISCAGGDSYKSKFIKL